MNTVMNPNTGECISVVVDDMIKKAVVMSTDRTHIKIYVCGSVAMVTPSDVIGYTRRINPLLS